MIARTEVLVLVFSLHFYLYCVIRCSWNASATFHFLILKWIFCYIHVIQSIIFGTTCKRITVAVDMMKRTVLRFYLHCVLRCSWGAGANFHFSILKWVFCYIQRIIFGSPIKWTTVAVEMLPRANVGIVMCCSHRQRWWFCNISWSYNWYLCVQIIV
jgi:hypothetical protein